MGCNGRPPANTEKPITSPPPPPKKWEQKEESDLPKEELNGESSFWSFCVGWFFGAS